MSTTFHYGSDTAPYTVSRPTTIRMPMLGDETHLAALFVLEEGIPSEVIDEFVQKVYSESEVYHLWLADNSLGSFPDDFDVATVPSVSPAWRSPSVGKTIEEAFEFLSTLPNDAEVTMNRTYIVALDKHLYNTRNWVIVCKIDEEGTITTAPCVAQNPILHIDSLSWHLWPQYLERWRKEGKPFLR